MLEGVTTARPRDVREACRLLAGEGAMAVAGGTDVLVELRKHPAPGTLLVDLTGIEGLDRISLEGGRLLIGALVTHQQAAGSELVRRKAAALSMACSKVGSVQIRNRGTLAGNVANASPCADGLTALVGLGATATVCGPAGSTREVAVEELVEAPYRAAIAPGELITGFAVPAWEGASSYFVKLGRRKALAISRINAACAMRIEGGVIVECGLAVGSVMPRTMRVREAEHALVGRRADRKAAAAAGALVADEMVEISGVRWSTPYKRPAVAAVVERVVLGAMGET